MLSPLEKAVIDALLGEPGEPFDTIRHQLANARVPDRQFTGVGFFTDFVVNTDPLIKRDVPDLTLGDAGAEIPRLQHGAAFLLFIRGGVVAMLEGFTYHEPWPTSIDEFRVFKHEVKRYCEAVIAVEAPQITARPQ